jgi:hypothetical protein
MGIFMDLRDVMGVKYPKFNPSTCRNKSLILNFAGIKMQ